MVSEHVRYTAGYLGATFADQVDAEKTAITAGNKGIEPYMWYVDLEGSADFKNLLAEIEAGRISRVVMRDRGVLPNDVALIGEFFDAAMETGTELVYAEQRVAEPNERMLAQLVPLLHEWANGEAAFMAARGHFTIYAGLEDVRWLRGLLTENNTVQGRRWLNVLLAGVGGDGWMQSAPEAEDASPDAEA